MFVLSIDKKQIEASTKAVYGADFNATEYLRRFFDLEYGIPTPDTQLYTDKLISRFDLDANFDERTHPEIQYDRKHFVEYFDLLANAMNLSLRARERCITRLRIVMDNTPSDQYLKPVLVALLIILRSNLPDLYTQIINGEASPEDVIGKLNSLSGGKFEQSENFVTVIHAYLLIADPDRERAQNRGKELVREAKDRGEDSYAASLLRMKQIILQNNRSHMPIDEIAKKVDLVSWVRK